ncbi:TIGR03086 family metal-binding protein [Streptomyces marispadix]|uniref:TIGR03086 family metal-binding protein n=1 Tax=Streptomyces marispadix TaxID=2922868 RepID=A0ABS9T569_9ACTN|nr:TIGR03086 family metal-binding protein [Streptomyces marispadix]MCH6163667.1 TIGR03086 family metal-binding protein [Streptomyces marispadix]
MLDLGPQAREVKALLGGVRDDGLAAPTPCGSYSVRELLGHLLDLARAFTDAARKDLGAGTDRDPSASLPRLPDDWRERLPVQLDELAAAWRSEAAWEGDTRAGGVDLPGSVAGIVAINELVLHGWDLARATGQEYRGDPAALEASVGMLSQTGPAERAPMFGPAVEVSEEASLLDRAVALGGRSPDWSPPERSTAR